MKKKPRKTPRGGASSAGPKPIQTTTTAAEGPAWESFATKLAAIRTFRNAITFVTVPPPPDSPERRFYLNLGHFLTGFIVPEQSSEAERLLYIGLVQRLDAAGGLKRGAGERLVAEIRESFSDRQ